MFSFNVKKIRNKTVSLIKIKNNVFINRDVKPVDRIFSCAVYQATQLNIKPVHPEV